jgi:hypothetical protein
MLCLVSLTTENWPDFRSFKCPEVVPSAVKKGFDQEMEDTRNAGIRETSAKSQLRIRRQWAT